MSEHDLDAEGPFDSVTEAAIEQAIERAVAALRAGGLVALPTETVYGLAADASDPDAVRRIFDVKGRPPDHPLIVHLPHDPSGAHLERWAAAVTPDARALTREFWPGPLTIVVRRSSSVLDAVTGGRDSVALRVPAHPVALAVLHRFGRALAAPSANRFGRVSPTTAAHVHRDLGPYLDPDRDVVLDGGACRVGVESTIVDLTSEVPQILRPGDISAAAIERVIGRPVERVARGPARAPGMLEVHYAPQHTRVALVEADTGPRTAQQLLAAGRTVGVVSPARVVWPDAVSIIDVFEHYDAASLAPILYDRLRRADQLGLDDLLIVAPAASDGLGAAVLDRLRRAAAAHGPESRPDPQAHPRPDP